jgi:hypothetical protein
MNASPRRADAVVLPIALVLMAEVRLLGYIDPGSGALGWQVLIAALVGAAYYFRHSIRGLLARGRRRPRADYE